MLTFTEAQFAAWISPMIWPFIRVLALFTSSPVLGIRSVPVRVKVALALLITVAAQGSLTQNGAAPVIALDSPAALEALLSIHEALTVCCRAFSAAAARHSSCCHYYLL